MTKIIKNKKKKNHNIKKNSVKYNKKSKILYFFWYIITVHIIRYFFILINKPDFLAFRKSEITTNWTFTNFISFFSRQSVILIFIIITLNLFTNYQNKKWFRYLAFIGLIDILLSSLAYNFIIDNLNMLKNIYKNYNFLSISYFENVVFPFFYLIFFFVSKNIKNINLKKNYISLIHPSLYLFFFIIINSYNENLMPYPYSFINPKIGKCLLNFLYDKEPKGWIGLFINFSLISFIIYFLGLIILNFKKIFSNYNNKNKYYK
ncbi:hypothetical protein [Candidatus Phytoplasma oryzae]|nr:hypothetical protein PIE28_00655 [Candidatus Phytoplasma oryzae]